MKRKVRDKLYELDRLIQIAADFAHEMGFEELVDKLEITGAEVTKARTASTFAKQCIGLHKAAQALKPKQPKKTDIQKALTAIKTVGLPKSIHEELEKHA